MAGVSYVGHKITETLKSDTYTQQIWNSCKYWSEESGCSGGN